MTGQLLESSVLNQLKTVPVDVPVVVLMRHSIRGPLPEGSAGNDIPITDEGWQAARRLGAALGKQVRSIHTSPVRRCIETAQAILQGTGTWLPISEDRMLGDPGAFVLDGRLAWGNWQRLGNEGVMRHLAEHDDPLPGMANPLIASKELLTHLLKCADGKPGINFFVTHDAVVSPVASRVVRVPVDQSVTPQFLEAIVVWSPGATLTATYRDWRVDLPAW